MHSIIVIKENNNGVLEANNTALIDDLEREIETASNSITESHKGKQSSYYLGKKHGLEVALELIKGL